MPELPSFRYFPDPVGQGAIVRQETICVSCGERREYCYGGPVYGLGNVEAEEICPWCIADGPAASKLDVEFLDASEVSTLDEETRAILTTRTPCYSAWQQEVWLSHCDDACAFVGCVGTAELAKLPGEASDAVRRALREWGRSDDEREQMFGWLHREGDLTGYLFRCLHCGVYEAHIDAS